MVGALALIVSRLPRNDALGRVMIGRYKRSIVSLIRMLRRFEEDPKQFSLLYDVQKTLVCRIKYLERRIAQTKKQQKLLKSLRKSGELSRWQLKDHQKQLIKRSKEYQYLLYCFRHIGDGFAHLLFNKWDIKPLSAKQPSGDLTGRTGLRKEINSLRLLIKAGLPAMFTDLTNCLRHGDICVSIDGAPLVGEVKSNQNVNARVSRQIKGIERFQDYLITDQAEDLFGMNRVRRVELDLYEIDYRGSLNELIQNAKKVGYAVRDVEPGLRYAVFWHDCGMPVLRSLFKGMRAPIGFFLNEAKSLTAWTPYYPFVLSIRDPEDVMAFVGGDLIIMVIVDHAAIQEQSNSLGCLVEPVNEPFRGFRFKTIEDGSTPGECLVSAHFFSRIAFEFVSLQWFVSVSCCKACSEVVTARNTGS